MSELERFVVFAGMILVVLLLERIAKTLGTIRELLTPHND
jgi:hypothetical protein